MKILLDENFPKSAVDTIVEAGYEPIAFDSVLSYGANDEEVFATAQSLGAILLTSDRDFYHTVPLLHPCHHGIIVVALRQPNRAAIQQRLSWLLETFTESFENKVFILRDYSCRVK